MTRPVIAGVDGSERGVDAARFAAEALTAQLLVVGHHRRGFLDHLGRSRTPLCTGPPVPSW
jgi:hypothetical protein